MSKFEDEMRARYWELKKVRDPIAQEINDLKAQRNNLLAEYEPRVRELENVIRQRNEESGLFEMDMEIGGILRAIGNKPGRDPSLPPEEEPEAATEPAPESPAS